MITITEIIPDQGLPDWAVDAMASGQFFRIALAKIELLEASNQHLSSEVAIRNDEMAKDIAVITKLRTEIAELTEAHDPASNVV